MGGKGSGGYRKGSLEKARRTAPSEPRSADPERVHWSVELGKRLLPLDKCDLSDPDAIRERFALFLQCCDECHMKPLMTAWAMALGISRKDLLRASVGDAATCRRLEVTSKSQDVLQKCYEFLQVTWEDLLTSEKGNPVKWIFLGKNYFGYTDTTEKITRHIDETPKLASPEEMAAKYALQLGKDPVQGELVEVQDVPQELPPASEDCSSEVGEDA